MGTPSSTLSTLRPDLAGSFTEFDLEMGRRQLVGTRVLPIVEVLKASGKFGKISVEQLLQGRDAQRAPGAGYNRGDFEFTDQSFACNEYGLEEPVDEREAKLYAQYFDAELVATQRCVDGVLREQEKRIAAAIFNATTWTGAALTTAVTNEWDDTANATPLADVRAAGGKVFDGTGMWPNALVINRKVFRNLQDCAEIIDRVKYSGLQDPNRRNITPQALADAFDLRYVFVAGGAKNTATEGQSASLSSVWSDEYAMVCRVAETNDIREPCIGRTFHWSEDGSSPLGTIETYDEPNRRSRIVRCRHDVDEVVLYTGLGHLLSNITT